MTTAPIDKDDLLKRIYNAISGSDPCFHLTRDPSRRETGIKIMDTLKAMFGGQAPVQEERPDTVTVRPFSPLEEAVAEALENPDVGSVIVVTDRPEEPKKRTRQPKQEGGPSADVLRSAAAVLELLRSTGLWMSKSDILGRTHIPESHWPEVTSHLLSSEEVTKQGERKHTKYRAK